MVNINIQTVSIMKLTQIALQRISDSRSLPKKLAGVLKVSRVTMWRYINDNHDSLTKAAALQVIREETGLADHEILEPEKQVA